MREMTVTTTRAFIKRHAVGLLRPDVRSSHGAASSWWAVLAASRAPAGKPTRGSWPQSSAMLAGPSVAGILLTGLVSGKAGLRELLSRLLKWRVGARWYAVALLTAPLLVTAVLLALSLISPVFLPAIVTTDDKAALLLSGIAAGLAGGFFEELGWTGFAIPRLRRRYGVLGDRAHRGRPVGRVAPASDVLGRAALPPERSPWPSSCRCISFLLWRTDGLPGAHGVGLRPYWEPARGDAHARESHSQHALRPHASGDRGVLLDL